MTDITNAAGPKNAGTKPRLSLLSSKQSTRLKSEDCPPEQPNLNLQNSIYNSGRPGEAGSSGSGICDGSASDESTFNNNNHDLGPSPGNGRGRLNAATEANLDELGPKSPTSPSQPPPAPPSNGPNGGGQLNRTDVDKTSVCKEDLIRLLSMMKSELQSKEIAIANMKLEQLKRLINPVEISRSALASTYIELQNRLKANDKLKNSCKLPSSDDPEATSSALAVSKQLANCKSEDGARNKSISNNKTNDCVIGQSEEDENLTLLNTLLELLDRHPLLALPRDSLYCLDYTCNELSTKNYLNLKIQHLENLIDQHRRFRYFIGERLKRSEQRYLDLTLKLEGEKNLRIEKEREAYKNEGKSILLKHIDQIKKALEKEKASKHAIVMTLLNELLDERERNEELSQRVLELEAKLAENTQGKTKSPQVKHQQSSPASSQQKPRVPAKPAQLLDRQRSQTNNR